MRAGPTLRKKEEVSPVKEDEGGSHPKKKGRGPKGLANTF